jgi:thiol-disulfide isomerase/thioredoxin
MNQALQIGPLSLPFGLLLILVAIGLGGFAAHRVARAAGIDAEPTLTQMLIVGFLAARLGYVLRWHEQYLELPSSIVNIRDGGWEPAAGVIAALLFGLLRARRNAGLRRVVVTAPVIAGGVLLLGGIAAILLKPPPVLLPSLNLQSLEGRAVSLAGFVGKPTVVNLWASWCPPCRREMPAMQQAQAANPEVNFVFVNQGEEHPAVVEYLSRQRLVLRNVLLDPQGSTGAALDSGALPTTLFFDATGRLVSARLGELSSATLDQRLAEIRAVSRATPRPANPSR